MISNKQQIKSKLLEDKKITLFIKREDQLHPFISGNKYRKLKYNLNEAKKNNFDSIVTYGGAYSNHIAATAYAGKENNIKTVGVIRGEELADKWQENPTLSFANANGMHFKFVSREWYRTKDKTTALQVLEAEFGQFYNLPEGGTNQLAVKGCQEILSDKDESFDVICTAVGTGGTIAGIINSTKENQKVIGFPALKGDFLQKDIRKFTDKSNWSLNSDYNFGGYAKVSEELIDFINDFKLVLNIPLDPIYTGKMMYGILDLIQKDYFKPGTKILAIHTGGLQGIAGMNTKLKKKNSPLLLL
ncbi:pyridoxal-phosphate dependent enzyme [Cellulophaga baltica]|uniref:1-aminocyclopropane-1-carboxylate deaminase/D-cysteine desulfhydrase n=1 Tax=Cellulophaga TaxID=104264 RepID=UPI001C072DC3|nr:pyridoxal-phosphate dependent enzyme [Cellulophaga sp. 1_MG-2023]MBU2995349.1 pyridoxal-phosphate dependent enzyme [Cellulophaga baltica]MDO6766744.1 pyridoxal-phosphate dependent enzyme [Cellulophaga sp. 1_MG-2023]